MSDANYANRKLADKAKLFPTSIVKNSYKNLFGGDIRYYASGRFSENDSKAFILAFQSIPQEACIELATRDWQSGLGLVAMKTFGQDKNVNSLGKSSLTNCTSQYSKSESLVCAKDMPMSIEHAVDACSTEGSNNIYWKFY